ncbi:ApeA N-terminal domain 1-containing protein [Nocardia beijingensis]
MYAKLRHTLDGTLAYFCVSYDTKGIDSNSVPGYVHLTDQGELLLDTMDSLPGIELEGAIPEAIPAWTTKTGAIFFDFQRVRTNHIWGGSAISTCSYHAGFVAVHVDAHDLRSTGLTRLEAHFPGLTLWSGMQGIHISDEPGQDGRLESVTATVRARKARTEDLGNGRSLALSTHWDVSGPRDRQTFNAPVSFSSLSDSPLEWREHLSVLIAVQDLLSLAYKGFVVADGGLANFDLIKHDPYSTVPKWWSRRLMLVPKAVETPPSMDEYPTFSLADIGGLAGVKRWLELRNVHKRAAGPLVNRYRFGSTAAESQLLDIASAIEYWTAVNRRSHPWAKKLAEGPVCLPLVRHIGDPFADFVGNPEKWADQFWDLYNLLKHNPNEAYDSYACSVLAQTGALLIECALLNHAAATDSPAKAICASHSNRQLRDNVRSLLAV